LVVALYNEVLSEFDLYYALVECGFFEFAVITVFSPSKNAIEDAKSQSAKFSLQEQKGAGPLRTLLQ
jgi:hypothetical protein